MSNNQLDLSAFPTIAPSLPEEQKIEVEKRSLGLITIRDIMENLVNVMQSYLGDLQALDAQARMLEQQKMELGEIDKQVRFAHKELEAKEANIDSQLEFIAIRGKELVEEELKIQAEKDDFKKEQHDAERTLELKEQAVNVKLKEAEGLEEKFNELKDLQTVIDNASAQDKERKALLDAREQKILQREARLARLENESKIG